MFDYETLRFIWWLLVGVLLIGFAVMDGHDMGVGTLLPFAGRDDIERRVIINTVGPHWDGNQVWFITAGGALFAAWPLVYAAAFSGFYWALLAVLWALFFRPVGFDFRSKIDNPTWRNAWDWGIFVGSAVPPLIFGVAFGNLLQGVPFHFDVDLVSHYTGSFWQLLNPFALLTGVVSVAMITFHGANYLMHRTEGAVYARARTASLIFGLLLLATFALAGVWVTAGIGGYAIAAGADPAGASNPLLKSVTVAPRRMALELRAPSADDAGACGGLRRHAGRARPRAAGMDADRVRRLVGGDGRRDRHRGSLDVPLRDAVQFRPALEPDRVGCHVEPSDARDHVLGGRDLHAAHRLLHALGVRRDGRQGHRGLHPRE